ncbi:MAG: triose-phosphate isomerase [Anaerolineae bacterium]|jgi:triosephosphate isomerase
MRKPFALANWKMAMTIPQGLTFVRQLLPLVDDLTDQVDVVICPPYTAISTVGEVLVDANIALGGQDLWADPDTSHTGAISGRLLVDAGAEWVLVGHWEIRRRLGEDDAAIQRKVRAALDAGLRPILLIGEPDGTTFDPHRLSILLADCLPEEIAQMAFVYEPEGAIGRSDPVPPEHAAEGCRAIRTWLRDWWGQPVSTQARIIYGGSVTPEHAPDLVADPDVDGLGVGRKGRDPVAFAEIIRIISRTV